MSRVRIHLLPSVIFAERTHTRSTSSASTSSIHSIPESAEEDARNSQSTITAASARSVSELDKLFAKLGGVPTNGVSQSQSQRPAQALTNSDITATQLISNMRGPSVSPSPPTTAAPTRGLSLLDTIFASATSPPARAPSQPYQSEFVQSTPSAAHSTTTITNTPTAYSQDHHILSPKPTSSALPQVLNQEVISTLLGLPPSRASSVRYEGDNESSDEGASEPGSLTNIPQLTVPHGMASYSACNIVRVLGDVTPRASLRGFGSDIHQVSDLLTAAAHAGNQQQQQQQRVQQLLAPSNTHLQIPTATQAVPTTSPNDVSSTTNSTHTPAVNCNNATNAKSTNNPPRIRPLVPFDTDSDLWPYPRAPLVETDSDIIELDFADTSALSDPDAFERYVKGKKQKKTKKDKQKERDEIEKSWDFPAPACVASPAKAPPPLVNGNAKCHSPHSKVSQVASPSPAVAAATIATPGATNSVDHAVDANGVRGSLLSTITASQQADRLKNLSKKDFVREVLTLIYVRVLCRILMHTLTCVSVDRQAVRRRFMAALFLSCLGCRTSFPGLSMCRCFLWYHTV